MDFRQPCKSPTALSAPAWTYSRRAPTSALPGSHSREAPTLGSRSRTRSRSPTGVGRRRHAHRPFRRKTPGGTPSHHSRTQRPRGPAPRRNPGPRQRLPSLQSHRCTSELSMARPAQLNNAKVPEQARARSATVPQPEGTAPHRQPTARPWQPVPDREAMACTPRTQRLTPGTARAPRAEKKSKRAPPAHAATPGPAWGHAHRTCCPSRR
jgi:hypothetical protein